MNNLLNVINGANIKYVFRIDAAVLAAYSGEELDPADAGYLQFTFNQIKLINEAFSSNNQYHFLMKNGFMQGASSGIPDLQGSIVFRDGKESSIEVIKRWLYDRFMILAPNLLTPAGSDEEFSEFGFSDVTNILGNVSLPQTYEESQFYKLSDIQLPPFDIIAYATKADGEGVIAKKEWLGIKIIGSGSGDEVSSVESNSVVSFIFAKLNDWVRYESDETVLSGVN